MSNGLNLTILQSIRTNNWSYGQVLLTRKFMEATLKFNSLCKPVFITELMKETKQENDNLDKKIFKLNELPFKLKLVDFERVSPAQLRNQTSLVLATVGDRQNHISKVCKKAWIPVTIYRKIADPVYLLSYLR